MDFLVLGAISSERGLDLAWRREVVKTSVRGAALPGCYRPGNRRKRKSGSAELSLHDGTRQVEVEAEILLRISREFGKSIEC
jgi:hypothetical protein